MDGESEKLQRGKPYPLGDPLSVAECGWFGVDWNKQWLSGPERSDHRRRVNGIYQGESFMPIVRPTISLPSTTSPVW